MEPASHSTKTPNPESVSLAGEVLHWICTGEPIQLSNPLQDKAPRRWPGPCCSFACAAASVAAGTEPRCVHAQSGLSDDFL